VLFGPAVDLGSRGLRIRREWGLVVVGERVLEGGRDGESFLHPESVRGVEFLGRFTSLQLGDIIFGGTPPSVGLGQKPVYPRPGKQRPLSCQGLGPQDQMVVAAE
jgi:hypothetical protein